MSEPGGLAYEQGKGSKDRLSALPGNSEFPGYLLIF